MSGLSRNGYVLQPVGSKSLTTIKVGGAAFTVWKPSAKIWAHFLRFMNAVEPFKEAGWDGGHAVRPVRGTTSTPSEHWAGTAVDLNASQHPRGSTQYAGWDAGQVRMIRWYLGTTQPGKLFFWGADFSTTPDAMHFQLKPKAVWDKTDGWWKH